MKITLIILLVLCTSCFAQTPYITDVTSRGIEYSLFDNDTILLAKNMLYVPSSTSLTNAQMKAELLAEVDSVKNLDIAGLDSVVIDIGNGWNLVIDSTLVEQNTFNIHYRVLDNTYVAAHDSVAAIGQVLVDTKPIDNTVEFVVAAQRMELIQDAQTYKTAVLFRRDMSQFIGTYILP